MYFHKDKYPLQNEHWKCVLLTKEKRIGFKKRTASWFRFGLWVGSSMGARAITFLVVSEPRFRWFYKIVLKFFVNDFEIVYDMHCIFL